MPLSTAISRVYETRDRLTKEKTVPSDLRANLDKGLILSFGQPWQHTPIPTGQGRKNPQIYRTRWRLKNAQLDYCAVRKLDVDILLPFILSIHPKACETLDVAEFDQHHRKRFKIPLSDDCKQLLENRGKELGIENSEYEAFIKHLFNPDPPQRPQPITNAENETHCALYLARIDSIRNVFGDYIQRVVENSLTRLHETANGHPPESTQSVWMKLPHQSMQDAIFHLNVGSAKELVRVLFPHMNQKFASFLSPEASSSSNTSKTVMQPGGQSLGLALGNLPDDGDCAYFTLRGASVSAITSLFTTYVCDAIECSDLRLWESENLLLQTTDCVTLNLWRSQPDFGFIRLRVGFSMSMSFLNNLYT